MFFPEKVDIVGNVGVHPLIGADGIGKVHDIADSVEFPFAPGIRQECHAFHIPVIVEHLFPAGGNIFAESGLPAV